MKTLAAVLAALALAAPLRAELRTKVVDYKDGDVVLQGYAAWDDGFKGRRPGVLVVHEWTGHGPYVRRRAEMLAKLGYVAFAADMYGKGVFAKDHDEAAKLSGVFFKDRELMRRRASAGLAELRKLDQADKGRLAAVGYCFGGASVLELARMGADLKGVASFHGALATSVPAQEKPKARILVMTGGDDNFVGGQVKDFVDEMRKAGADWEMDTYGGAVHSFTVAEAGGDSSTGMAYNKEADERSWKRMQNFFDEIFGK